ncbi:S8 family serine peptidase [Marinobacterium sedimentorum]|uniref:S8 family serine peptidase n=1 Tax=Marinobacterium sedimentorum TaxID=2927804 RepID=UPI0020C647ED|nr:S8 family serine peptidase [Marinobacterium sedimentorum]MCP8690182.1 hypothetical protein [Marinobacterium sedimentorum]
MPFLSIVFVLLIQLWLPQAKADSRVAIVDRFFPSPGSLATPQEQDMQRWMYGMLDLDGDQIKEPYYHGDLVRLIATHPRLSFFLYPISSDMHPLDSIVLNLREIRARLERQPVDVLVLSWESSTLISAFEVPLHRSRAAHYLATLEKWSQESGNWNSTLAIIRELEALVDAGVIVVTIAGNGGRGMVNTFSFARGVITVGAIEPELARFVSDNALVDRREQAAYFARLLSTPDGELLGYDLNGDLCADVPLAKLSSYDKGAHDLPRRPWPPLKGSSFAAPAAVKKILLADLASGSNWLGGPTSDACGRHAAP